MNNSRSFISPKSNATSSKYNTSDFLLGKIVSVYHLQNLFCFVVGGLIGFTCLFPLPSFSRLSPSLPSTKPSILPCIHVLSFSGHALYGLDTASLASTAALSIVSHWPSSFWVHMSCFLMYLQSSFLEESCLPATIGLASLLTP